MGADTFIDVSSTGHFDHGYNAAYTDLTIKLSGVNALYSSGILLDTLNDLISRGNLLV